MIRSLFLIFAALVVLLCAGTVAVGQPAAIPKPDWSVGQSWQVKCPIISSLSGAAYAGPRLDTRKVLGYYTLTFTVLRRESIGKSECWAVHISTGADFKDKAQTLYAYYRTNDLSVMREPESEDFYLGKDGAPIYRERTVCPDYPEHHFYPIEMPLFPLVPGKDATRLLSDAKAAYPHDPTPERLSVKSVSRVEAAPEEGSGAVKVTLTWVETDLKSRTTTKDYEEQIWKPGKPWWSSAKAPGDIAAHTLIEGGAAK
jgi:hypothetical protein